MSKNTARGIMAAMVVLCLTVLAVAAFKDSIATPTEVKSAIQKRAKLPLHTLLDG